MEGKLLKVEWGLGCDLVENACLSCTKLSVPDPALQILGMMMHASNPSTWSWGEGRNIREAQGHPQLHSEFEAMPGFKFLSQNTNGKLKEKWFLNYSKGKSMDCRFCLLTARLWLHTLSSQSLHTTLQTAVVCCLLYGCNIVYLFN